MTSQHQDFELPDTMRAVVSYGKGKDFADETLPLPELRPHDLLVKVRAVSMNPIDTKRRALVPEGEKAVLGWDAVGEVVALGEKAEGFQPGDRVFYAGQVDRAGSNSEYQAVDARIVALAPESLSDQQAVAMPLTALTAWECLFSKLKLNAESAGTLLVVGAAGGVGSLLVQLAKELTALRVIALASREESATWLRELGADHVINYKDADYIQQIKDLAPKGVDYVFSSRTPGHGECIVEVLRPFGEVVVIDEADGIDLMSMKTKALSWHWESMFARPVFGWDVATQGTVLAKVAKMLDSGQLRTTVQKELGPINAANIAKAHEEIAQGRMVGKLVISGWE